MNYNLSIIIPVYKTEKYIEKCIESVCNQTLDCFEIILVNDCSPDNSIQIAKSVLRKYPNRLEHTQIIEMPTNSGIGKVREVAIQAAKGTYIASLDSDDYMELDGLESMLNIAIQNDADVVMCDYIAEYQDKQIIIKQDIHKLPYHLASQLFLGKICNMYWNKLYKKSILENIEFLPNINMGEDLCLLAQVLLKVNKNKVIYLPKHYVHYTRYNYTSYTANYSDKSRYDVKNILDFIDYLLSNNQYPYEIIQCFNLMKAKYKYFFIILMPNKLHELINIYPDAYKNIPKFEKLKLWEFAVNKLAEKNITSGIYFLCFLKKIHSKVKYMFRKYQ